MQDWLRLDNAALIFPAVRKAGWSNAFRVSATLAEEIDPVCLQQAVDSLRERFPSVYVCLHRGFFWYYLQKIKTSPKVREDAACPLIHMTKPELRECCFRVLYYKNRIAVEFFHALTDGNGGMVYLKTLTAAYLSLRYGFKPQAQYGVLDWMAAPEESELEDSFLKAAGRIALDRKEENSIHLKGTRRKDGFHYLTVGTVPEEELKARAQECNTSVTAFLAAVMLQTVLDLAKHKKTRKWAKITIPVDLRRLFGGNTLRNFVLTVDVGVDPKLGEYSLEELCKAVQSQMNSQITEKQMAARIAANVKPARMMLVRIMPLFIKNIALKLVYHFVGESKGTLNISNLGRSELPPEMVPYVENLDFIIGTQATYFHNCSVVTYKGKVRINLIRNVEESELERNFLTRLVKLGIPVKVESNFGGGSLCIAQIAEWN